MWDFKFQDLHSSPGIFTLDLSLNLGFPLYQMGILPSPSRECHEAINKNTKHVKVICGWEHALRMVFLIPVRVSTLILLAQSSSDPEVLVTLSPWESGAGWPPALFSSCLVMPPHGGLE